MTKAEFLSWYKDVWVNSDYSIYDAAFYGQYVADDEELVEMAKTCLISNEDFQDYVEDSVYDVLEDTSNTV